MNSWLLLSLLAPLLWGFTNAMDTAVRRHFIKSDYAATWFLAMTRLPVIIALLMFIDWRAPSSTIMWMLIAGALWITPFIFYYRAMEFEEPSRIVLIFQMSHLFVLLFAFLLIGENLSLEQLWGFLLLLSGGIFAGIKRLEGLWRLSRAFWIILIGTTIWALADVLFKKMEPGFPNFMAALLWYLVGSFIPCILVLVFPKWRRLLKTSFHKLPGRTWFLISLNQVFGLGGTIIFAYALTLGKASLTSVMIGVQPLLALLWGFLLSRWIPEVAREDVHRSTLLMKGASLVLILGGLFILQISHV